MKKENTEIWKFYPMFGVVTVESFKFMKVQFYAAVLIYIFYFMPFHFFFLLLQLRIISEGR